LAPAPAHACTIHACMVLLLLIRRRFNSSPSISTSPPTFLTSQAFSLPAAVRPETIKRHLLSVYGSAETGRGEEAGRLVAMENGGRPANDALTAKSALRKRGPLTVGSWPSKQQLASVHTSRAIQLACLSSLDCRPHLSRRNVIANTCSRTWTGCRSSSSSSS